MTCKYRIDMDAYYAHCQLKGEDCDDESCEDCPSYSEPSFRDDLPLINDDDLLQGAQFPGLRGKRPRKGGF